MSGKVHKIEMIVVDTEGYGVEAMIDEMKYGCDSGIVIVTSTTTKNIEYALYYIGRSDRYI